LTLLAGYSTRNMSAPNTEAAPPTYNPGYVSGSEEQNKQQQTDKKQ